MFDQKYFNGLHFNPLYFIQEGTDVADLPFQEIVVFTTDLSRSDAIAERIDRLRSRVAVESSIQRGISERSSIHSYSDAINKKIDKLRSKTANESVVESGVAEVIKYMKT